DRDVGWLRAYDRDMRYAQRGGDTPAEQQRRERLRLPAAEPVAWGDGVDEIAHDPRGTQGAGGRWDRSRPGGGTGAPRAQGAGFAGTAEPAAVGPAGGRAAEGPAGARVHK